MSGEKTVYYVARGKVQEVMFRKTLILAAVTFGVSAGGTNSKEDQDRVDVTITGVSDKVDALVTRLGSGSPLNSIGACVVSFTEVEYGCAVCEHVTHTGQFEAFEKPTGVEFYV